MQGIVLNINMFLKKNKKKHRPVLYEGMLHMQKCLHSCYDLQIVVMSSEVRKLITVSFIIIIILDWRCC